jgi:hypothetical protein
VPWLGNWSLERFAGHWCEDQRVKKIAEQLEKEIGAAELSYAAAGLFLDGIARAMKFQAQLDEEFKGKLFLEGLTDKENRLRAEWYTHLCMRLQSMLKGAVTAMVEAAGGRRTLVTQTLEKYVERHTKGTERFCWKSPPRPCPTRNPCRVAMHGWAVPNDVN